MSFDNTIESKIDMISNLEWTWIDPKEEIESDQSSELCDLLISSFEIAYKDHTLEELGINSSSSLESYFQENIHHKITSAETTNEENVTLRVFIRDPSKQSLLVAYGAFQLDKEKSTMFVRSMVVHPTYWRLGIGRLLLFSVPNIIFYNINDENCSSSFELFRQIENKRFKRIIVITRKLNRISHAFLNGVGFSQLNEPVSNIVSLPSYASQAHLVAFEYLII
jgi:hypothetical protein